MSGPMAGLSVLEVANMIAGPSATALMADLGADVIKVEPPTGDILRDAHRPLIDWDPGRPHVDPYFTLDNRGKRSVAVDLTTDEGVGVVHRLARRADIFLTNLTDDRRARYRLMPEDLRPAHPTLIYALVGGYGTVGPLAGRPAYDWTAFFARGGASALLSEEGGPPPSFRPGQGDHTTALALLAGVLAALRDRDRTGEGQVVDVALFGVAAWTLSSDLSVTLIDGRDPERPRRAAWPNPLTCRYRCADGWVAMCMPGPRDFWDAFCIALDRPEWTAETRWATHEDRLACAAEIIAAVDEVFATATVAEWTPRLDGAGLVWAPAQEPSQVVTDPQAEALRLWREVPDTRTGGTVRTVAAPFQLSGSDVAPRGPAPGLGEHDREVLAEAGWSGVEIDRLVEAGVIGRRPRT